MTPNNQEMHAELEARSSSWLSRHTFFAMLIGALRGDKRDDNGITPVHSSQL
jgi:hypothetical protein